MNENGDVTRQAELYEIGRLLRYNAEHLEDEFGALAEISIDMFDAEYIAISSEDFEALWTEI